MLKVSVKFLMISVLLMSGCAGPCLIPTNKQDEYRSFLRDCLTHTNSSYNYCEIKTEKFLGICGR